MDYPMIVFIENKHVDEYFIAQSPEELARLAYVKLQERHTQGYYPSVQEEVQRYIANIGNTLPEEVRNVSEEELESLPAPFRDYLKEQKSIHESKIREIEDSYVSELQFERLLDMLLSAEPEKAVKMVVGKRRENLAWKLLTMRSEYEYEKVQLLEITPIK